MFVNKMLNLTEEEVLKEYVFLNFSVYTFLFLMPNWLMGARVFGWVQNKKLQWWNSYLQVNPGNLNLLRVTAAFAVHRMKLVIRIEGKAEWKRRKLTCKIVGGICRIFGRVGWVILWYQAVCLDTTIKRSKRKGVKVIHADCFTL